jgi:hypothetical protein
VHSRPYKEMWLVGRAQGVQFVADSLGQRQLLVNFDICNTLAVNINTPKNFQFRTELIKFYLSVVWIFTPTIKR